jgi:Tripartite tricarboxylate transporter TctB family/Sulfite exporter TauE/SafE
MKPLLARYSNSAMTLVMLAIFLVLVGIAVGYPAEARFMPLVVGIPPILLCLVQLVLDARERRQLAADTRSDIEKAQDKLARLVGHPVNVDLIQAALPNAVEPDIAPQERVRRELILWGYFLGFIGGILLFGFWVAIPIFLVAFLRFQARSSWRTSLLLGLGASIALFLVFERGLKVQLHNGFIVNYALDRLDR